MPLQFRAFGLYLCADESISALTASATETKPDVLVHWVGPRGNHETASLKQIYATAHPDRDGKPTLVVSTDEEGRYLFHYADGTRFLIAADGSEVTATWPENMTSEDTATYFLGPVLGFIAGLRGRSSLHASSVRAGDGAIAVVGCAGAGKSTTAAALVQRGCPLISEDVTVLDDNAGRFHVLPGYPHIRLWPESVEILYGSRDALPPITPNWDKRDFDVLALGHQFEDQPQPLKRIYILDERRPGGETAIEPVAGPDAVITLVANTYVNYLHDEKARAKEFEIIGRLVRSVPVFRVFPPAEAKYLDGLCAALIEHAA